MGLGLGQGGGLSMIGTGLVAEGLDATTWEAVEPAFEALRARAVGTAGELERWLEDRSELDAACSEAMARLYINMTCDTGDEAAAGAYAAFIADVRPKLERAGFELDRRQAALLAELGGVGVGGGGGGGVGGGRYGVLARATAADVGLFREANVPINAELSGLDQRYDAICGAMTVEFDGATRTPAQMGVYQEVTDRGVRERAWRAVAGRRLADRGAIDGIYDRMVGLRAEMARNAGHDGYVSYAFASRHRFDYTPADCAAFHRSVDRVIMPFCEGLDARRAREMGLGELRAWDVSVDPRGRGPLRPFEGGVDLVAKTRRVMRALDPELAGLFESLGDGSNARGIRDGAQLDLDSRAGKAPGGYQYMQDRSRRPFIFMNAAGLHRDVETMVHEAGHAFHSQLCGGERLVAYRHSPIEFAEVASMSMELLTMRHWGVEGGFYGGDAGALARAQRKQLEGTLSLLPWIATIDAFQHWVYGNPGHTREERTGAWLGLMERFGYRGHRVAWAEEDRPALESAWQAQGHLFGSPFYYIEYGIAQLGALQLWVKSRREGEAAALGAYKRALALGGSRPLPELFEAAGIRFDFSEAMFERVRAEVEGALAELEAGG